MFNCSYYLMEIKLANNLLKCMQTNIDADISNIPTYPMSSDRPWIRSNRLRRIFYRKYWPILTMLGLKLSQYSIDNYASPIATILRYFISELDGDLFNIQSDWVLLSEKMRCSTNFNKRCDAPLIFGSKQKIHCATRIKYHIASNRHI